MIDKTVQITLLYDLYKNLLTPKQKQIIELYHFDNLSLGEIAQITGITRPAVHDLLKRTESFLMNTEDKIRFLEYRLDIHVIINKIKEIIKDSGLNTSDREAVNRLILEMAPFEDGEG
jgi:predicted DNA-binding protein YlxM (UPF0122 family)